MQRTSEKPDTLRSEKRARDWLKDGAKHGDFSRGEGLEALKQAQSIAKEEQAKNLTIGAISEKKAKSLAIAAANRATGVPRKTINRHLAADLTGGVRKRARSPSWTVTNMVFASRGSSLIISFIARTSGSVSIGIL